jgi:hypothetical protein
MKNLVAAAVNSIYDVMCFVLVVGFCVRGVLRVRKRR